MTLENTNLYVAVKNSNSAEPAVINIDCNPISPANGGINADGVWNQMSQDSEYFDYYNRIPGGNGACESLSPVYRSWLNSFNNSMPCQFRPDLTPPQIDYEGCCCCFPSLRVVAQINLTITHSYLIIIFGSEKIYL